MVIDQGYHTGRKGLGCRSVHQVDSRHGEGEVALSFTAASISEMSTLLDIFNALPAASNHSRTAY